MVPVFKPLIEKEEIDASRESLESDRGSRQYQ